MLRLRTLAVVLACGSAAAAGDAPLPSGYVVEASDVEIVAAPAGATPLFDPSAPRDWAAVEPPFRFRFYGRECGALSVSPHGCASPAAPGFEDAADPSLPHGQQGASGSFPYASGGAASADGVIAPLWTRASARTVRAWTTGSSPGRRFIVSWEGFPPAAGDAGVVQLHLHEETSRIAFAYGRAAGTTPSGAASPPAEAGSAVVGLDEPDGLRAAVPAAPRAASGIPATGLTFDPRTVRFNAPGAPKRGRAVEWERSRKESLSGEGGARNCPYVAKGTGWFHVADRDLSAAGGPRGADMRRAALAEEDRALFPGGKGDPSRWVRQIVDGKITLIPDEGDAPVRVWFRIVEFFTLDDRGLAGEDSHTWNIRRMLRASLPADDPRSLVENYVAWRAQARCRLTVGKLFDAAQPSDAARQFSTGRINEYVLWRGRIRFGARGAMPRDDAPAEGWNRFSLLDHDDLAVQWGDRGSLRFAADPAYVDGGYEYVVSSDDWPSGWVSRRRAPHPAMAGEDMDSDPPAAPREPR